MKIELRLNDGTLIQSLFLQNGTDDIVALKHQIKCLEKSENESAQRAFEATNRVKALEDANAELNSRISRQKVQIERGESYERDLEKKLDVRARELCKIREEKNKLENRLSHIEKTLKGELDAEIQIPF